MDCIFSCDQCGKILDVDENQRGQNVTCPECGALVTVLNDELSDEASSRSAVDGSEIKGSERRRLHLKHEGASAASANTGNLLSTAKSAADKSNDRDLREVHPSKAFENRRQRSFKASWILPLIFVGAAICGIYNRQWIMDRVYRLGFFTNSGDKVDPLRI